MNKKKKHLHASEALKKSYEGDMLIAMSSDAKWYLRHSLDKPVKNMNQQFHFYQYMELFNCFIALEYFCYNY